MPKRVGFLLEKIADESNLRRAVEVFVKTRERAGSRRRLSVLLKEPGLSNLVCELRGQILAGEYKVSAPVRFMRYDSLSRKNREICAFSTHDNIVQTAMVSVIEPVLYKGAYFNSCCNVKGKGIARIEKYIKQFARADDRKRRMAEAKGKRYRSPVANFAKLDLRKFYDSIDHAHLRRLLRRKIKDEAAVDLIMRFAEANGVRGLCIGGRISHVLANFYLEGFDRKILNSAACTRYARYMDDCVIWGANKSKLHALVRSLADDAPVFGLGVKCGWCVAPWKSRAVDFCGYLFYRDGGSGIRKRIKLRIIRRMRALARGISDKRLINSLASYVGYIKRGNRECLCGKYLGVHGVDGLKMFLNNKRKELDDRKDKATV